MNIDIINHVASSRGRFDRKGRFIYLPIAKAMSGTIDVLLGDRAVHQKMNSKIYSRKLRMSFCAEEYEQKKLEYLNKTRDEVFIFSFVRNPWDRVVSALSYLPNKNLKGFMFSGSLTAKQFQRFVKKVLVKHGPSFYVDFREQSDYLLLNDEPFVDFIGRYEQFPKDWIYVSDKIGLVNRNIPVLRKSKHKHYSHYYDDESRMIVSKLFSKDIKLLGYNFEESN